MPQWLSDVIAPLPADSSDLRWAVETVAAMWSRGDRKKTLLWLRQAVETARGDGQDDRAAALALAVAEFERLPPPSSQSQSSSNVLAQAPASPEPSSNAERPQMKRSVPPTAPYRLSLDAATHVGAPDDAMLDALRQKDTDPDQPPVSGDEREPAAPSNRPGPLESTVVMDSDVGAVPARAQSDAPSTLETPIIALEPMRARRVAVRQGSGRELVVMLLDDDEAPPSGAQEAMLVALRRAPVR
jgi:hypothetical protein